MNSIKLKQNNLDCLLDIKNWSSLGLDPYKGLLLHGNIGTGKTTFFLDSFLPTLDKQLHFGSREGLFSGNVKTLVRQLKKAAASKEENAYTKMQEYYLSHGILLDDLGRESKDINIYGNKEQPIVDLLEKYYEGFKACINFYKERGLENATYKYVQAKLIHGTSNMSLEELSSCYDDYLFDRMKEMLNFISVEGDSRRD